MRQGKRDRGVPIVASGRKLDLSPEERERRSEAMRDLHRQGKAGGPLSGRPRRGESAAEARARREQEARERAEKASKPPETDAEPPEPLPAPELPPRAPEPADERIQRAMAAAGHRAAERARVSGPPGGPLTSRSTWQTRGAGQGG